MRFENQNLQEGVVPLHDIDVYNTLDRLVSKTDAQADLSQLMNLEAEEKP